MTVAVRSQRGEGVVHVQALKPANTHRLLEARARGPLTWRLTMVRNGTTFASTALSIRRSLRGVAPGGPPEHRPPGRPSSADRLTAPRSPPVPPRLRARLHRRALPIPRWPSFQPARLAQFSTGLDIPERDRTGPCARIACRRPPRVHNRSPLAAKRGLCRPLAGEDCRESREAAASSIPRSRFALHDTSAGYLARFRPRPSLKSAAVCRKCDLSGTTGPGRGRPEKTEKARLRGPFCE